MVRGHLAGDRLGHLFRHLSAYAGSPQGAAYLRVRNWYYMAFILVVAILHIVNNLAVPVSFGHAKSYSAFSGVPGCDDAVVVWATTPSRSSLTAGFLGMMYYYLPVRAGRPIFSYRLSIISFWGITFMYMWAGSHHLHYTASAGNALLTLNGAWHRFATTRPCAS